MKLQTPEFQTSKFLKNCFLTSSTIFSWAIVLILDYRHVTTLLRCNNSVEITFWVNILENKFSKLNRNFRFMKILPDWRDCFAFAEKLQLLAPGARFTYKGKPCQAKAEKMQFRNIDLMRLYMRPLGVLYQKSLDLEYGYWLICQSL